MSNCGKTIGKKECAKLWQLNEKIPATVAAQ